MANFLGNNAWRRRRLANESNEQLLLRRDSLGILTRIGFYIEVGAIEKKLVVATFKAAHDGPPFVNLKGWSLESAIPRLRLQETIRHSYVLGVWRS